MFKKNQAVTIHFVLVNATNGSALTGATVAAYRTLDNGTQSAATGSVTELANGQYKFAAAAADMNGDTVGLLITATNAVPVGYEIKTATKLVSELADAPAAPSAADIWAHATRVLTAGTNIVLAKGTGITGFNDIAATAIVSGGAITTSGGAVSTVGAVTGAVGSVTAGVTVADKTGFSLSQAFPANFASLGINASGHVSRVTLADTLTTYTGNTPQTGDSFARIGATGSGLTSLAPSATALSTAVWTGTKAGYLDAAVSSVSTGGVSASDIATAVWDAAPADVSLGEIAVAVRTELAVELARIDVAVSTRAAAATALSNAVWTNAKAAFLDAAISGVSTGGVSTSDIAAAVWDAAPASTPLADVAAAVWDAAPAGTPLADFATAVRTELAVELARIDASISGVSTGGVSTSDIAAAVRTNLATELGRIDVAVSTRAAAATALSTAVWTSTKAGYLDAAVSSVSTGGVSASDIATAVWATGTRTTTGGTITSVTGSVGSVAAAVTLNLAQVGLVPRSLNAVADSNLTVGDALVAAIVAAAGKETVSGTSYTVKTPSTGTTVRTFTLTLDDDGAPTARN